VLQRARCRDPGKAADDRPGFRLRYARGSRRLKFLTARVAQWLQLGRKQHHLISAAPFQLCAEISRISFFL
jgi:hypothetical protein